MTTTLVIGAHGKVGRLVVRDLAAKGHTVLAGFRKEKQFETVADVQGVHPVLFDLDQGPKEMASFLHDQQVDQIVFSAGAGGAAPAARTTEIDLDGAVKTMEAAKIAKVGRYIMVSAAGVDDRATWKKSGIYTYFMMKHYADQILQGTGLDYTIVRPVTLSDEAGTGKIAMTATADQPKIPRADVAAFIAAVIDNQTTYGQVYELTAGDQAISDLFAAQA
ncbi:SDR family oxidoreductase [Leuconostocaceae bacterium ESL0958]|nr:SDR family oxidoreductase [Leuconostocaceae bacterium ESL0958]